MGFEPWSLHRNIYGYTNRFPSDLTSGPAATAPTALIKVFFIIVSSFPSVLKYDTAPKTSWKYVGKGNPSALEIKLVITTKRN